MFTIRRRLLTVTGLTVLALAQIMPASATTDYMSHGLCFGTGNSTRASVSSAYTTNGTTSENCWVFLQMNWYDPITGVYIPKAAKSGYINGGQYYYDSIGINTSLSTYHEVGYSPGAGQHDDGYTYA